MLLDENIFRKIYRIMCVIHVLQCVYFFSCCYSYHLLENMIYKGLDDEEASFLNVIVDQQALQIRNMLNREKEEISIYRVCVYVVLQLGYCVYSTFTKF